MCSGGTKVLRPQFCTMARYFGMQYPPLSEIQRDCTDLLVDESTTVRRAAELLVTMNVSQLIVRDNTNRLTGIVTENAVVRELMNPTGTKLVVKIQSRHVESARESASVDSILPLFRSSCHALLPVVNDDGRVTGVLHRSDVVRLLLSTPPRTDRTPVERPDRPHFLKRHEKQNSNQRPSESGQQ